MGNIPSLPQSLIWSQEEGVFHSFALQQRVHENFKKNDKRGGQNGEEGEEEESSGKKTNNRANSPSKTKRGVQSEENHSPMKKGGHNSSGENLKGLGTIEGRQYLYTDSAKKRLGLDTTN